MDQTPSQPVLKPDSPWSQPRGGSQPKPDGEQRPGGSRIISPRIGLAIGFMAMLAGLIGWLFAEYGDRFDGSSDGPRLFALLLIVVGAGAGVGLALRRYAGLKRLLRMAAGWVVIGAGVVLAYSYRADLHPIWQRLAGELDPSRPVNIAGGSPQNNVNQEEFRAFTIRQSQDGHFYAMARVNGTETRLLVDTGATVTVLSLGHAERAGIFPAPGDFTVQVRTASGFARAASVTLRELEFGEARLTDVSALVMRTPGDLSVLGMSTLQRFRSYDVRDGVLTIRW